MEKFITAAGCATRVTDSCRGERAILLLHGYLETLEVWEDFAKLLTPQLRVITMDIPGHGISQVMGEEHTMEMCADVAAAALENLGVEHCYVAGHSMGGYVALEMMRKYPAKVAGLILFNSTPDPDPEAKREAREREVEMVLGGKKDLIARMAIPERFAPVNLRRMAGEIEGLEALAEICDDEGVAALLRGMGSRRDSNEVIERSASPTLFIVGAQDPYLPAETLERLRRNHPRSKFVVIEDSGHMSLFEKPEESARAILDFCLET